MPSVLVINPNTSRSMTEDIQNTAERVFPGSWQCTVTTAPGGPESLESWTDYALASVCVLPLAEAYSGVDGVVLACFGDPGLYLLKENWDVPVVGIAEASMSMALLLGARFGILAGMDRAVELMDSLVMTYGLTDRYAGTQPLGIRVLDFENQRSQTLDALINASQTLRERGAETLLLGCAGLTSFTSNLQKAVNMPVIDPVEAGCRMLQSLVRMKLMTSQAGLFARPATQRMNNLEDLFSSSFAEQLRKRRNEGTE
jgi:allantoin racemase